MKLVQTIFIYAVIFSLSAAICIASDMSQEHLLTDFYLTSHLGIRTLADQSTTNDNFVSLKSPNEAFLYSFAIPGMGQLYNGSKYGYIYTAAEVGLWITYFVLRNSAVNTREDYRELVRENVIFIGPGSFEEWDEIEDYEHATQYENWNHVYDSEATRNRTGKWYWKDLDPSLKDAKDTGIEFDSKHRLQAYDLRQEANATFENARTVLGLVILNHVFSAVEARISTKRWNNKQQQNRAFEVTFKADFSTDAPRGALVLKRKF
ncbi:hypothetical protein F4083_00055 [Candidatus Poribacteria bacterium]|nr:hypothetical protein [Candidatus Poribacteria bacterium]MYF55704.1 hypothetical protein [Candidatus Poribacteria bacterium]MYI92712.1 hypothetical protein [Candidatus Poribacteria bacterium]